MWQSPCINGVKTRMKEFLIAILILETFLIDFLSLDLVIFIYFSSWPNTNVFNNRNMGWS